jgi:sugar phosphate isomerase/epimerase
MLRRIAPTARSLGLRITQENYDYFGSADLVRICQAVGEPHVGVHSDTGNWLILGEDPVAATEAVLPYTLHAHVRDYVVENDTYNGVALGDGLVDFERVLPVLARAPVEELIFSMEVDTDDRDEDEAAERSYAHLAAWLAKNGYR